MSGFVRIALAFRGVARAELDVAFVVDTPVHADVEAAGVFADKAVMVAHAGHALIRHPRDVLSCTVMAFHVGCVFRRRLEAWYAKQGLVPERILEFNSYHAILGCVVAGAGIAFVPQTVLEVSIDSKILSVHEPDRALADYDTMRLWHRHARASAARQAFIGMVPPKRLK